MSLEEIRDVVKQERTSQEELEKAREKAAGLIAKSKERAHAITEELKNPEYYEELFKKKSEEIENKKQLIEKETVKKIEQIHEKTCTLTMKKAASMIVEYVLEE